MFKKDLKLAKKIQKGDKDTWDIFVARFSDWAFTCAIKITRTKYWHPNVATLQYIDTDGNKYTYTEDAGDAYLWFLERVKNNLHQYSGRIPLQDFVCLWINTNRFTRLDYLKWKFKNAEYIPAAIQQYPQEIQKVFKMLRMRKSEEDIARKLKISIARAFELVAEVEHIAIKEELYPLLRTPEQATDFSEGFYSDKDTQTEKWLFDEMVQKYFSAVNNLTNEEKILLQLRSESNVNTDVILQTFRLTGITLPGVEEMESANKDAVFRSTERTKYHLRNLLGNECSDWGIQQIDTKTVTMLLEELGVSQHDQF